MQKKVGCVLLVDDSAATNNYNKRLIEDINFAAHIQLELSGTAAMNYILDPYSTLPDLILLDVNMPGMDGFNFLTEFSALDESYKKNVVVILSTTTISDSDKKKAEKFGIIAQHLNKPLSRENFYQIWSDYFAETA